MTGAAPLTIVTYDWVPEFARGFVRDIRARWAAEEAGLAYRVETVPVREKTDAHRAMQPFEQVMAASSCSRAERSSGISGRSPRR